MKNKFSYEGNSLTPIVFPSLRREEELERLWRFLKDLKGILILALAVRKR